MRRLVFMLAAMTMAGCAQVGTSGSAVTAPPQSLRTTNTQATSLQSAETLIPYSDLLTYSENWPEISRRRLGE